jgi:hypothetical protein
VAFNVQIPRGLQQTPLADLADSGKCTFPWMRWFEELVAAIKSAFASAAPSRTEFTSDSGDFTVAHGLGYSPSTAVIVMGAQGDVCFQLDTGHLKWDATNFYLNGSAGSLVGEVVSWR